MRNVRGQDLRREGISGVILSRGGGAAVVLPEVEVFLLP